MAHDPGKIKSFCQITVAPPWQVLVAVQDAGLGAGTLFAQGTVTAGGQLRLRIALPQLMLIVKLPPVVVAPVTKM